MSESAHLEHVLSEAILPLLPEVALKILSLQPETEAADIARIISQDPSLSARILKAANSPLYAPLTPVGNIKRAVILLGDRQVKTLTLAFSLIPLQDSHLDFSRFWEHSLVTAIGTRRVLKVTSPKQADEGFTAGLLANIGVVLLAGSRPAQYLAILKDSEGSFVAQTELERAAFGFDHIELGVAAARRWRFPESFQAVLGRHLEPKTFPGEGDARSYVEAAHLAGMLADLFFSEHPAMVKKAILKTIEKNPAMHPLTASDLEEGIAEEIQETSSWMSVRVKPEKSLTEILEEANRRLVAITAEYEETMQWLYRTHMDLIQGARHPSAKNKS